MLTLSHITALEVLRRWDAPRLIARGRDDSGGAAPTDPPSSEALERAMEACPALAQTSEPRHLIVSQREGRRHCSGVVTHLLSGALPPQATFRLGHDVSCSSPELLALQMAEYATDLELLLLIDELCGLYAIQPTAKLGLISRTSPLTTPERIAAFLDQMGPRRGASKLRRALADARAGAASPREAMTVHRLEFSPRRGGYGLKVVALNEPIQVARVDRILGEAGTRIRMPDIVLLSPNEGAGTAMPFRGVAIDYQGGYHRDPLQEASDTNRRNELLACGIKDYELDAQHFESVPYMDWLARAIRSDLGIGEPRRSPEAEEAYRVRRELLAQRLAKIDGLTWTGRDVPLYSAGSRLS